MISRVTDMDRSPLLVVLVTERLSTPGCAPAPASTSTSSWCALRYLFIVIATTSSCTPTQPCSQPVPRPPPRAGANKYNAKQLTNYCLNWLPTNTAKVYFCSFSKLYHSSSRRITISNRVITPPPIGELSIVMSVSVCAHVCLCLCVLSVRDQIFGITRPIFTNFLCMLPMAVARSFSGGVLVPYVFPVLG